MSRGILRDLENVLLPQTVQVIEHASLDRAVEILTVQQALIALRVRTRHRSVPMMKNKIKMAQVDAQIMQNAWVIETAAPQDGAKEIVIVQIKQLQLKTSAQ